MITSNGARVHDKDNNLMYSNSVPSDLVQPVIDLVRQDPDIFVHIYRDEKWLLDREDEALASIHNESSFTFDTFDSHAAPTTEIAKIFFTHPNKEHEHLVQFESLLNDKFAGRLNVSFSTPWCLEVMAAEVSKGEALKIIAESLGLTLKNCIAFGDGMNDVEMLTMAGKGLVMETAHDKVKNALPDNEVIGSNTNDAVAHYLHSHLL